MDNSEFSDYMYVLKIFGEEKVNLRFEYLYKRIEKFLEVGDFGDSVILNEETLSQVVVDYFADIDRLKEFHGIECTNKTKRTSYLSYWFLCRKPLQLTKEPEEHKKIFINEKFVFSSLIMDHIDTLCNIGSHTVLKEKVQEFIDTCMYYMKYRRYSAQSLELMLLSFQAGLCCDIVSKKQMMLNLLNKIYKGDFEFLTPKEKISYRSLLDELKEKGYILLDYKSRFSDGSDIKIPFPVITHEGINFLEVNGLEK
jgi:hypothetical protein